MMDIVRNWAAGKSASSRFGAREALAAGVLWGLLVTSSETLSQPALYLEPAEFLSFYGRIAIHYAAGGATLSLLSLWIARRSRGSRACVAACLAIILAAGVSLVVERLTVWFVPVFGSDVMLELTADYLDLAIYLSWNFAFFGGVYVLAFFLLWRSTRLRDQLRSAEWTRLTSEAMLDHAIAEDRSGLLQPALLLEAVAELGRRYTSDPDRGDRLLDLLVRFLRSAMSRLSMRDSDLAAELDLAGNYARLCRELERPGCSFAIDRSIDGTAVAFPPLILVRLLDELSREAPPGERMRLRLARSGKVVTLAIECAGLLRQSLSEITERRAGIALRAVAGDGAAIRWRAAGTDGADGARLEITLPVQSGQDQPSDTKEEEACRD